METPPRRVWLAREEDRSILDGVTQEIAKLKSRLGVHDRAKLGEYLDAIRDVEQRIARAESTNTRFRRTGTAGRRAGDVQRSTPS